MEYQEDWYSFDNRSINYFELTKKQRQKVVSILTFPS